MKSTVVDESLSSFKTNVLFQRIPSFYKVYIFTSAVFFGWAQTVMVFAKDGTY